MNRSSTTVASAGVVLVAILLQVLIHFVAPRVAGDPASHEQLSAGAQPQSGLAIPGLAHALGPSPTAGMINNGALPTPRQLVPQPTILAGAPTAAATIAPTPFTHGLTAYMQVTPRDVMAGGVLLYQVFVRGSDTRLVNVTFTITTHTPAGTLRCTPGVMNVDWCVIPGDYDGTSSASGDPHTNPVAQNATMTIPAGESVLLMSFRVQVAQVSQPGTVFLNHVHISGGPGNALVTAFSPTARVVAQTTQPAAG